MNTNRVAQADALLGALQRERAGQLKVFLGAAPGVGKTYAMLNAAKELRRQDIDVVVGFVETHGRAETEALIEGLELLPRRAVAYKAHQLTEMDLDALLLRKPQVAVVDELAHTNAPGSRHERRYQDIEELLDAGIDVYTTVNIQHIESLNDVVRQITGVSVRETVPDAFLDRARDIVLVDLPPRELIERLRQGKVYVPDQAASALQSFFSPSNLTALRDLAVQQVADRVDADMREYMVARGVGPIPVRRRVIAAIDGFDNSEYLVRVTRKIAERRQAPWAVVFVDTGHVDADRRRRVDSCFALAKRLGGEGVLLRGIAIVDEMLAYASRNAVSTIIIGRTRERPVARMFNRTLTQQLLQKGAHFELTIINTPYARARARRALERNTERVAVPWQELAYATFATSVAVVLAAVAEWWFGFDELSLIFITAVLFVAVRTRMSVAVYAAVLCFLSYNFFFITPRYTLYITASEGVTTVAMFLAAALICGRLANRLRSQVMLLRSAHGHTEALQMLGAELAKAADEAEVQRAMLRAIRAVVDTQAIILNLEESTGRLIDGAGELAGLNLDLPARAAADWCLTHQQPSGHGTDTLQGVPWWCLPLSAGERRLGVLCLHAGDHNNRLTPEIISLIQAMAHSASDAMARTRLVDQLETARMQGETERLRAALLSSVSHDLRSPLSTIVGSAESLNLYREQLSEDDRHVLTENILLEGQRLDRYIQNLLDMTRLGHGSLSIDREWVSLHEISAATVARLHKSYPAVQVELRLPDGLPLLHVHPALIEQALFNVMENAARFTPVGKPITVTAVSHDREMQIEISDHGPGIPESERQHIFDMFYSVGRGDRDDRNKPGTGLGLTICQGMIGAHGGHVFAMAGPHGQGTTIRIMLPLLDELVQDI